MAKTKKKKIDKKKQLKKKMQTVGVVMVIPVSYTHLDVYKRQQLYHAAKEYGVSVELLKYVHDHGKLPVLNFSAGGVATPADAALMMQLGAQGVFVGSGIFKSKDPERRAKAVVQACLLYTSRCV